MKELVSRKPFDDALKKIRKIEMKRLKNPKILVTAKRKVIEGWIGGNWMEWWERVIWFFDNEEELQITPKPLIKKDTKEDKKDVKIRLTIQELPKPKGKEK